MVIVLSLLASFFHIYKVVGATERSHYTFSFLIHGFTFAHFGIAEVLVVILISNLAEWLWNRPLVGLSRYSTYPATSLPQLVPSLSLGLINPSGHYNVARRFVHCDQMGIFTFLNHFLILGIVLGCAVEKISRSPECWMSFPF